MSLSFRRFSSYVLVELCGISYGILSMGVSSLLITTTMYVKLTVMALLYALRTLLFVT
jgi:hypothetical protein